MHFVRLENEVTAKHLAMKDGRVVLVISNGAYHEMVPDNIEVLGRVILAGNWKEC
jgi:SOS-response transcriptional repressor LexA